MDPLEEVWAGTESGVILRELKILVAIWLKETDFKIIGGILAVLEN